MGRPRTVTDAAILSATARAIARLGPARLTLADVGREVGLSPATLLQRFGSKRGLLLALAAGAPSSVGACFAAVRAAHRSPLGALAVAATEMARQARSPQELANHLAFLRIDLSDRDFHRLALDHARRVVAGYRALLDEAVAAGELAACDTARLARAVEAVAGGALIAWAIHRVGTAEARVRADLDTLLRPRARVGAGRRDMSRARGGDRRPRVPARPR